VGASGHVPLIGEGAEMVVDGIELWRRGAEAPRGETSFVSAQLFFPFHMDLVSSSRSVRKPENHLLLGQAHMGDGRKTYRQTNKPRIKVFTGGNDVNSLKGGISKIWGETLLLLLLITSKNARALHRERKI
jgi:hypothetical protein